MIRKPIILKDLELSLPHKTCFENFNCTISCGSRIAITGRNGSGKTTLLKIIAGCMKASNGSVLVLGDDTIEYIPQSNDDQDKKSGGQRLISAIKDALSRDPAILLLDEPTNHLDQSNRKYLMRWLQNFKGTLILVSHDTELMRQCINTIWHIANGKIQVFSGDYEDYINEIKLRRASVEKELELLNYQKKDQHHKLMKEQIRASKSKAYGEKKYKDDKLALRGAQAQGESTHNRKKAEIKHHKEELLSKLNSLRLPEVILPKFSLETSEPDNKSLVHISDGTIGFSAGKILLTGINLILLAKQRVALIGDNGSGKSTLIKAILKDPSIYKSGDWYVTKRENIGYLDQHYHNLNVNKTILETIKELVPHWPSAEIRRHLNDFLFRKNEEVNALIGQLSEGEKARLSLAQIAAKSPKLLILDEITNNLDLETREHVMQVLKSFPGAIMIISHDNDFLKKIGIDNYFKINNGLLIEQKILQKFS